MSPLPRGIHSLKMPGRSLSAANFFCLTAFIKHRELGGALLDKGSETNLLASPQRHASSLRIACLLGKTTVTFFKEIKMAKSIHSKLSVFKASALRIAGTNIRGGVNPVSGLYDITSSIVELASTIAAQGLLQNLVGYLDPADKTSALIVAGGRRLTAIRYAMEKGWISVDYTVDVKLVREEDAELVGLIENGTHEVMNPAKEAVAYSKLVARGYSAEDVAAIFSVDVAFVQRRVRLTSVAPEIFAAFETGVLSLDSIRAFTVSSDHEQQRQVFGMLAPNFDATRIRKLLTESSVSMDRPIVSWVGLSAYLEAGGRLQSDLYHDQSYLLDVVLLENLAKQKLESETISALAHESWAWVEYCTRPISNFELQYTLGYRYAPYVHDTLSEADQVEVDALNDALSDLDDTDDFADEQAESLQAQIEAIESRYSRVAEEAKPFAGVVACFNSEGQLHLIRGVMRNDDVKAHLAALRNSDTSTDTKLVEKSKYSERIVREVTANQTFALQAELMANHHVALCMLAARLVSQLDFSLFSVETNLLDIKLTVFSGDSVESTSDSRAVKLLSEAEQNWKAKLSQCDDSLFSTLLSWEAAEVTALISFVVARSLNAQSATVSRRNPGIDKLSNALNFDMSDYWEPTPSTYFNMMKKEHIIADLSPYASATDLAAMVKMKKSELVHKATKVLSDKKWLPDFVVPKACELVCAD